MTSYLISIGDLAKHSAVASQRAAQNLPALETFIIDVISATEASLEHDDAAWLAKMKLSSTFIRGWIAERESLEKDGM
jgi:hypothetical protein